MKPVKSIILSFLFGVFIISCDKDDEAETPAQNNYATRYEKLSIASWNTLNDEFQKTNAHSGLRLNENGYLEGEIDLENFYQLNTELVLDTLASLIQKYAVYMGMPKSTTINLEQDLICETGEQVSEYLDSAEWSGKKVYRLYLPQQNLNGQPFCGLQPEIKFSFIGIDKTIKISGNWIPEALSPTDVAYTKTAALKIAAEHFADKTNASNWDLQSENLDVERAFYLREYSDYLLVLDCWDIKMVSGSNSIYTIHVDTQTGKIIGKPSVWHLK